MSKMLESNLLPEGQFFRFFGGKTRLIKHLLPLVPTHKIYVEVFGGSAELLFSKPRSFLEVYNDIDGELVNLFEVVRNKPLEFIEKAEFLVYSRELQERWRRAKPPEDPVEWALRTWYIYQTTFAGKRFSGWAFARKVNQVKSFRPRLDRISKLHKRLEAVHIDHLDFRRCLKNWDSDKSFFFLDPPYRNVTHSNLRKMSDVDYHDLAEICKKLEGKFLLTVNDDPLFHKLFKWFTISKFACETSGQGITRKYPAKHRARYQNLFIRNYRAPRRKKKT